MNIRGLDYNTARQHLELPEYGREIQKMVDYALAISNREERQLCAETIVKTMQRVSPQMMGDEETRHKYWDHLAVMSNFQLDIDYPMDVAEARKLHAKPERLAYSNDNNGVCHYGVLLFETFEKLKLMPACQERDILAMRTANIMFRCLKEYGRSSASETKVIDDIAFYTDGAIQLNPANVHFTMPLSMKNQNSKKKKRK